MHSYSNPNPDFSHNSCSSPPSPRRLRRLLTSLSLVIVLAALFATPLLALVLRTWTDITPAGTWSIGYFLQQVNGKAYFAFQNSGGAYALVEASDGTATDIIPSGTWNAISPNSVAINNKGYFAFRDQSTNVFSIYELDNTTWTDVTPPFTGTWTIVNGATGVGADGYFAMQDDASNYHMMHFNNGTWTDITPAGTWNIGFFIQQYNGKGYFGFQNQSSGNYALVEVSNGTASDVIPSGTWNFTSQRATVANNKGYFPLRDQGTNTYRIYELDNTTWTDVTPPFTGTWNVVNGATAIGSDGYFAMQDDASNYHMMHFNNGTWADITPAGTWTIGYLVQQVNGKAYFAFQSSGGTYALLEVSGSTAVDVIPSGTWNAISTNATVINGKGYFGFRDQSSSAFSLYERDNSTWTDVTPPITGTWTIVNGASTIGSDGYFAIQSNSTDYHMMHLALTAVGDLTIVKQATPEDDTVFNFNGSSTLGSFSLQDPSNNTRSFTNTVAGTYTLTETLPFAWALSDASCTGGSFGTVTNGVTVTIDEGDNITCTFTNTEVGTGNLTIVKEANPADDTTFNFTGSPTLGNFTLQDPSNNSRTFTDTLAGTYTLTETLPTGWELTNADCTGGSFGAVTNGITVTVSDGADITCTFTNTEVGSGNLTIVKEADPADDTTFTFNGGPILGNFSLQDPSNNTQIFTDTLAATYTITEALPANWNLNDASCTGGSFGTVTNGITVTVNDGADVTCTFMNEKEFLIYLPVVLK